jgi:hypothetical protein
LFIFLKTCINEFEIILAQKVWKYPKC